MRKRYSHKHHDYQPVKATVLVFDNNNNTPGPVAEEAHVFDNLEVMDKWATKRNAAENKHGRRIRVIWMQSLTCSGSIHFL